MASRRLGPDRRFRVRCLPSRPWCRLEQSEPGSVRHSQSASSGSSMHVPVTTSVWLVCKIAARRFRSAESAGVKIAAIRQTRPRQIGRRGAISTSVSSGRISAAIRLGRLRLGDHIWCDVVSSMGRAPHRPHLRSPQWFRVWPSEFKRVTTSSTGVSACATMSSAAACKLTCNCGPNAKRVDVDTVLTIECSSSRLPLSVLAQQKQGRIRHLRLFSLPFVQLHRVQFRR